MFEHINKATPENIAQEVEKILNDANYREEMVSNLTQIKKLLESDKQENIAELILKVI